MAHTVTITGEQLRTAIDNGLVLGSFSGVPNELVWFGGPDVIGYSSALVADYVAMTEWAAETWDRDDFADGETYTIDMDDLDELAFAMA